MNKKELLQSAIKKLRTQKEHATTTEQLNKKFDQVLLAFRETISTRILEKIIGDVEVKNASEIVGGIASAFEDSLKTHIGKNGEVTAKALNKAIGDAVKELSAVIGETRAVEVHNTLKTVITEAVEIKGEVHVKKDDTALIGAIYDAIGGLIKVISGMAGRVFRVKLGSEHYTTPQKVILWDLDKNKPISAKDFSGDTVIPAFTGGGVGGGFRQSAPIIGSGRVVLSTAGTRQQLPNVKVSKVYIQAGLNNGGEVVIGGSTVVADASTRQGIALSSTQWAEFNVKNLNRLYIDGTNNNDTINYTYESYE